MPIDFKKQIILDNIYFKYQKDWVLKNINLTIYEQDYVGIVGPNGGGKTTLIKIISGLLAPQKGEISLLKNVGYVAQRAFCWENNFPITVYEVVGLGRVNKNFLDFLTKKDRQIIDESLQSVSMFDFRRKLFSELSGGQQQRVLIAKALAQRPRLLILDEPTTGVDVQNKDIFYRLLRNLHQKFGLTIILVSHDELVLKKEVQHLYLVNQELEKLF